MNTIKYDFGNQLKTAVAEVQANPQANNGMGDRKPLAPLAEGKYSAFVESITHGSFKTGSYGITITYVIESGPAKNRKIRDRIVLSKADGSATQFGANTLQRFLMAAGLPLEKLLAFKSPRNEHDLGDFRLAISAPVTISVKADGEYNGKPSRKVNGVFQRTVTE